MINKYTLSSLIVAFLSLIFGILCLFLFKEPTDEDFKIFEFSDSSDVNSKYYMTSRNTSKNDDNNSENSKGKTWSQISRDKLSKQEILMIDEIDSKLYQLNEQNQFTDTNLVQNTLRQISYRERSSRGYIKNMFYILVSFIVFSRSFFECLVVLTVLIQVHIPDQINREFGHSLLIGGTMTLVIPLAYLIKKSIIASGKFNEKHILLFMEIVLLVILIVANFIWDVIPGLWVTFFFMIFINHLNEIIISDFMSKLIPFYYSVLYVPSKYVISVYSAIGKIFVVLLVYVCSVNCKQGEHIVLGIIGILKIICFIVLIWNYNDLKIKAIVKLIKQRKELRENY